MPDDQGRPSTPRRRATARETESPPLTVLEGGLGDGNGSAGTGGSSGKPPSSGGTGNGPPGSGGGKRPGRRRRRLRVHKLRLGITLAGLGILALISTVFGMMMAVAQDLPSLETTNEFKVSRNSVLLDYTGKNTPEHRVAVLTGEENRILVESEDISANVKHATVAIEDQRFYEHKGVDYRGIARALWADVRRQRAVQGGSTITQQFVKNALLAQTKRSLFQKLKEAALAYQLERKWPKDKVLTQYLNAVYFGEGAYGVESAARVYFGWSHPGCEPNCASVLTSAEAALLAGMIASPSAYSPIQNPGAALERRNLVLKRMLEQDLILPSEYEQARKQTLPPRDKIRSPRKISKAPYFSAWLEPQLVERYGSGATFGGGLKIRTTLDLQLQAAAERAIESRLGGIGPAAAMVALDNETGAVRAMVGGSDFERQPFNLATQGHRQPGSAFKPFTLVTALEKGVSPGRLFSSTKKELSGPRGVFKVENYEDRYSGLISLAGATAVSDNSVYAELGYKLLGTKSIARTAQQLGIRTRVSRNPAMVLGGLRQGVTPLEMADAYLTLAHGGSRVSGKLAAYDGGPVAFTKVQGGSIDDSNDTRTRRVIPESVADQTTQILRTVVESGTGTAAATGGFAAGKTGTTEDYQDAWFVGYTDKLTVAIWVGYVKGGRPMETEYHGEPVAGGTFPAEIWRDFMLAAQRIHASRTKKPSPDEEAPPPGLSPAPEGTSPVPDQTSDRERTGKSKRRGGARQPSQEPERTPGGERGPATPAEPAPTAPTEPTPSPPSGGAGPGSGGTAPPGGGTQPGGSPPAGGAGGGPSGVP